MQLVSIADPATRSGVGFSPFRVMHYDPVVAVLQPPIGIMPLLMTVVIALRFLPRGSSGWSGNREYH